MSKDEEAAVGTAITIILVLAAVIAISKALFFLFLLGMGIAVIWFLLSSNSYEADTTAPAFLFIICAIGAGGTWVVGYWFGDSPLGKAVTTIADAINIAEEAEKNATLAVIDASQQATHEIAEQTNDSRVTENEKITNATYDILRVGVELNN